MTTIFTRIAVLGIAGLVFSAVPAAVSAADPDASFDETTLTTTSTKPRLSGEAEDLRTVRIVIEDEKGKRVFRSKDIRVKKDEWTARVTKKLKTGTYEVSIEGPKSMKYEVLATETLTIESKNDRKSGKSSDAKPSGSLSVSSLPLLVGGTGTPGASVPVAYIKVANPSKEEIAIGGFMLKQNGSASTASVKSFATNDDKGGSRTTVDASFKNGSAFVPLTATIGANQVRIFTIKAILGSSLEAGKTLMLDVTGATTDAAKVSSFPIRGTTWTLAR